MLDFNVKKKICVDYVCQYVLTVLSLLDIGFDNEQVLKKGRLNVFRVLMSSNSDGYWICDSVVSNILPFGSLKCCLFIPEIFAALGKDC